jgi:hypothetical protein
MAVADSAAIARLPWARVWTRRCRARREPRNSYDYHGRCELVPRHDGEHALERGMEICRWSTDWTE